MWQLSHVINSHTHTNKTSVQAMRGHLPSSIMTTATCTALPASPSASGGASSQTQELTHQVKRSRLLLFVLALQTFSPVSPTQKTHHSVSGLVDCLLSSRPINTERGTVHQSECNVGAWTESEGYEGLLITPWINYVTVACSALAVLAREQFGQHDAAWGWRWKCV